jgi:hypothetical protein
MPVNKAFHANSTMLSNSHFFPRKLTVRIRQKPGEKMAANYFEKLVKYTKIVYKIEHGFNKMKDGRVNPTHETSTVLLVILFGLFLRLRSFNEINNYIKRGEFSNLFKKGIHIPRVDTLRDTSKVTYMDGLTKQLD